MEIFSEIYNCYYQIMKNILSHTTAISLDELRLQVSNNGSDESLLYLIPKITSGEWDFFERDGEMFLSKISEDFFVPLTDLQKAYIKTILSDEKIKLFLDKNQIESIMHKLQDTPVLWKDEYFNYYDRYSNGDPFSDENYIKHFRTIIKAIKNHQFLDITYASKTNHRVHHHYLPCKLEYSIRNNKFRLLAMDKKASGRHINTLNLDRIVDISPLDIYAPESPDINSMIKTSNYKEPVKLFIHTNRNALERTMLHFANYEKNTTKIDDNTYECLIYYNKATETELLIEVLSFGPMVEVVGNKHFLWMIKKRLKKQKALLTSSLTADNAEK